MSIINNLKIRNTIDSVPFNYVNTTATFYLVKINYDNNSR